MKVCNNSILIINFFLSCGKILISSILILTPRDYRQLNYVPYGRRSNETFTLFRIIIQHFDSDEMKKSTKNKTHTNITFFGATLKEFIFFCCVWKIFLVRVRGEKGDGWTLHDAWKFAARNRTNNNRIM